MMYCDQNALNATANLLAVYLVCIGNVIGSDRFTHIKHIVIYHANCLTNMTYVLCMVYYCVC